MGDIEGNGSDSTLAASLLSTVRVRLDAAPGLPATELARQLGVSVRTLQRRLCGLDTTYQREVADARLRLAKKLMRSTSHPIKWIALEAGCASVQHFSTFFRDRTGLPPSRWRSSERE